MRKLLAALCLLMAAPAAAQVSGGTASDAVETQTLDLSVVGSISVGVLTPAVGLGATIACPLVLYAAR